MAISVFLYTYKHLFAPMWFGHHPVPPSLDHTNDGEQLQVAASTAFRRLIDLIYPFPHPSLADKAIPTATPGSHVTYLDSWAFSSFYLSAFICFACSATFHTSTCHSQVGPALRPPPSALPEVEMQETTVRQRGGGWRWARWSCRLGEKGEGEGAAAAAVYPSWLVSNNNLRSGSRMSWTTSCVDLLILHLALSSTPCFFSPPLFPPFDLDAPPRPAIALYDSQPPRPRPWDHMVEETSLSTLCSPPWTACTHSTVGISISV